MNKINIFWFRRDLRLEDNTGLFYACQSQYPVLPIFIFDENILSDLPENDARVSFIYDLLEKIDISLRKQGSGLLVKKGKPVEVWKELIEVYEIHNVYLNRDYEPYARERDNDIYQLLKENGIGLKHYKDQVIFEKSEVVKPDAKPYTVYTPYKKKWLTHFSPEKVVRHLSNENTNYYRHSAQLPSLHEIGFRRSEILVKDFHLENLQDYGQVRDIPAIRGTSLLSPHLRFGAISVRQIIRELKSGTEVFLSELIWREFFIQILYHFPKVAHSSFKPKYDQVMWRNNEEEFKSWRLGKTGFPIVDAGMRELNNTGYMHNRVRMIVASFLTKDLLIDWRWGEAYFAEKLLDFEQASNNGNWQWAAGTGCDAAPYFRIFNPTEQQKKFDPEFKYIKKWVEEFGTKDYPEPMLEHKYARLRTLSAYKDALKG